MAKKRIYENDEAYKNFRLEDYLPSIDRPKREKIPSAPKEEQPTEVASLFPAPDEPDTSAVMEAVSETLPIEKKNVWEDVDNNEEVATTAIETDDFPERTVARRISSKQRRLSFEEYRSTYLQIPKIADRKPVFVSGEVRDRLDEKGTQIIDADGLFLENNDTIAQGVIGQAQMNPRLTKSVGHIALSFSKEDAPRLNNAVVAQIAQEYMEHMGIKDTQYIIGRHFDKEHPHVHIAFNHIGNNGKTISDRNDCFRSERICKEFTKKYGLHFANGKEQVKADRLREPDKTRYELYQILKTEVGRCKNWNTMLERLE